MPVINWHVLYFTDTTEEKSEKTFSPTDKSGFFLLPSHCQVRENSEVAAVAWAAREMARSKWYSSLYFRMKVRVHQTLSSISVSSGHTINGEDCSESSGGLSSETKQAASSQVANFFHTLKSTLGIGNVLFTVSKMTKEAKLIT